MELILRADVENLGRLGDKVAVKPGYGRNYLIPQGLAMLASDANLRRFENERKKLQAKRDALASAAQSLADRLAAAEIVIEVRVGEGDKLYGSVTSGIIADRLAEKGIEIDRKKIVLDEPIRSLGVYEVPVKLLPELRGLVRVTVKRQGGAEEEPVLAPAGAPVTEAEASGQPEEETA
ncbi:ribosomal protein L9 [Solidesulfovibrio carbinoliphilus subsp. oakridgensis]|uniref:Large ribosomal subunit protein bL9 n=1 Tax=Solidesulfovibrio carbinoliphilus subsp. oakridgensis TaxID=694327 RepID=G7QDD6_9BACT|nr:50S ribosomal protein L9 [Solidesulfovibrio carbinoliphilus]EHJ46442.1 ribosomal protein L9 [Solidesulfovibrio carbinoliphilus subsp. oakridgensis]